MDTEFGTVMSCPGSALAFSQSLRRYQRQSIPNCIISLPPLYLKCCFILSANLIYIVYTIQYTYICIFIVHMYTVVPTKVEKKAR